MNGKDLVVGNDTDDIENLKEFMQSQIIENIFPWIDVSVIIGNPSNYFSAICLNEMDILDISKMFFITHSLI